MIKSIVRWINFCCLIGVDGQTVTIVTDPAGTPVVNQTFDYPILTSLTLTCMATASDGSPVTVTSYSWTDINCYTRTGGVLNPCFYGIGNPTGQNVTSSGILAADAGTVTCTATIDGMDYTSDPLTLRISGEWLHNNVIFIIKQAICRWFNLGHHKILKLCTTCHSPYRLEYCMDCSEISSIIFVYYSWDINLLYAPLFSMPLSIKFINIVSAHVTPLPSPCSILTVLVYYSFGSSGL